MKNKLSKSKENIQIKSLRSKSAIEREEAQKANYQKVISKAQPLQIADIPQLKNLRENFKKQVQNPINAQITMQFAKSAQRCLMHNNVITLYCLNERKPLCVTCMYQNNSHKKHKVIPLNRASQELQQQILAYISVVDKELDRTNKVLGQSHNFLQRAQRQFPEIISRVDKFYSGLRELLTQKRNEQIQHIEQTWARLRFQYGSLAKQLEYINVYFVEKMAELKQRGSEENLLMNRNIASHLVNITKIVPSNLCQYHQTKYDEELRKFEQIRNLINNRLVFTSPFQQKVSRNNSRRQSPARHSLTPSPPPKRTDKSTSNFKSQKKLEKYKAYQKSPQFWQKSPMKQQSSFKRTGSPIQRH